MNFHKKTFVFVKKGSAGIVSVPVLPETLEAPVRPGDEVGKIEYYNGETLLGTQPVVAAEGADPITLGAVFRLLLACLCRV